MNKKSSFEGENMQAQYSVLGYRIDLDFSNHNLPTEIDELMVIVTEILTMK